MLKPKYRTSRINRGLLLAIAVSLQATALTAQPIPIAILDFEANGISQTEAIALTDRLRNELFRLGQFEVVERGLMEEILLEQDFQLSGCTTNDCLVEVGRLIGARQVVGGRISKLGAMFTVSARVVDVETGKLLGVSDYDLRGGLEEMLTVGMKQVAEILSGSDAAAAPIRSRPDIEHSSQPASGIDAAQRARTWSISVGIGSSRNANVLEIAKDIVIGHHFSLFIGAGLGLENLAGGIAYRRNYSGKGLLLSASVGFKYVRPSITELYYDPFTGSMDTRPGSNSEVYWNTLTAYQWPIFRRGFIISGFAFVVQIDGPDFSSPYPVLSYEYRF